MTDSDAKRLPALASLATEALALWDVPADAKPRLINLSENATYLITSDTGLRAILRIHRENYNAHRAIECELAWMAALSRDGGVETAPPIAGRDGRAIQKHGTTDLSPRHMVMFRFLEGREPDSDEDLVPAFRQLGGLAARAHLHVMSWDLPLPFERLVWDDEAVFGPNPIWGDWRDGPGVDDRIARVLCDAEALLRRRLAAYGRGTDRYGLIHADMRLANLLVDGGQTRLIDFDDSGFGWFMYDFAAGISFMEDHPQVPALRAAWLAGYREVRPLSEEDEIEIDSFVILRRMALLAWIGSHGDTDLAMSQAPHFATVTAQLAETYLKRFAA